MATNYVSIKQASLSCYIGQSRQNKLELFKTANIYYLE